MTIPAIHTLLCERFGLDPAQVPPECLSATGDGDQVRVEWRGTATLSMVEFEALQDQAAEA